MRDGSKFFVHVLSIAALALISSPFADPSRAQTFEELLRNCDQCHGKNGVPRDSMTPVIWGQNKGYIFIQLRDYKSGDRKDELMTEVAADLDTILMTRLADYYADKTWPDLAQPAASQDVIARADQANQKVGCTGCHLDQYKGSGIAPRLAGQTHDYLAKTMTEIRSGERSNNLGMTRLMRATEPEDVAAFARYLAGL
jgi:cytochrome c553